MPAIYLWDYYTETGGLMSYGPGQLESSLLSGRYAGRILKVEKPADPPLPLSGTLNFPTAFLKRHLMAH